MKLHMIASVAMATLFSINAMAASTATYEAECKRYAVEDEVPADELADYMAQCVADMAAAAEAESGTATQGSGQ